jgi:hypothetical protein
LHANIWQTWGIRTQKGKSPASLSYSEALSKLLVKTVDACILAREDQIPRWFKWSSDMEAAQKQLLLDGAILKSGQYIVSIKV